MREIVVDGFGKINLALDVLYKRDDGYHEINTIMQQIDLKDTIVLRNRDKGINIECNDKSVPLDERNIVYKAWKKIVEKTGTNKGIDVTINKNIPVAAGLAGGSTNAAAVLKGLNKLWNLELPEEELLKMGKTIGADVPFCLVGGTAQAKGIGEKLKSIKSFSNKFILLANIGVEVSTPYVYRNLNLKNKGMFVDVEKVIKYIEDGNVKGVAENMANILETVVINKYPVIGKIKEEMIKFGALGALMTGSGPTVFGVFDDEDKLYNCKERMEEKIKKVIVTKTI